MSYISYVSQVFPFPIPGDPDFIRKGLCRNSNTCLARFQLLKEPVIPVKLGLLTARVISTPQGNQELERRPYSGPQFSPSMRRSDQPYILAPQLLCIMLKNCSCLLVP